jgi:hypothetical protein
LFSETGASLLLALNPVKYITSAHGIYVKRGAGAYTAHSSLALLDTQKTWRVKMSEARFQAPSTSEMVELH